MVERSDARGGSDPRQRRIALRRLTVLVALLVGIGGLAGDWIGGRTAAIAVVVGVLAAGVLQLLVAQATLPHPNSLPADSTSARGARETEGAEESEAAKETARHVRPTEANDAMLSALATAAAIRMFGGVIAVVLVLKLGRVDPLPFLAGFGSTYLALEIALARALIELERALRPR